MTINQQRGSIIDSTVPETRGQPLMNTIEANQPEESKRGPSDIESSSDSRSDETSSDCTHTMNEARKDYDIQRRLMY